MGRELPVIELWLVDIPDDRGAVRRCRMFGTWFAQRTYAADLTPEEHRKLNQSAKVALGKGAIALGVISGLAFLTWNATVGPHLAHFWLGRMAVLGVIPIVWLVWDYTFVGTRVRPAYAVSHRRTALAMHRCPWCLYPLREAPAVGGLTVCSECGGVWSLASSSAPSGITTSHS